MLNEKKFDDYCDCDFTIFTNLMSASIMSGTSIAIATIITGTKLGQKSHIGHNCQVYCKTCKQQISATIGKTRKRKGERSFLFVLSSPITS
jgi:hypothetical protein